MENAMEKMNFPYIYTRHNENGTPIFALEIFQYSLDGTDPFYAISYSIPALIPSNFPKLYTLQEVLIKRLSSENYEHCFSLVEEIANEILRTPRLKTIGIPKELINGNHIDWIHLNWTTREHSETYKWGHFADYLIEKNYPVVIASPNKNLYLYNVLQVFTGYAQTSFEDLHVNEVIDILHFNEIDDLLDILSDNTEVYRIRAEHNSKDDDEIFLIQEDYTAKGYMIIEKKEYDKRIQ